MATQEPKKRSITGKLVANKLTAREDDYTCNVIYQASRSLQDLCKLAEAKSKFTASELEAAYNDLRDRAREELFNASTVEFGFSTNSLGIEGPFFGPKAQFTPERNRVVIRSTTLAAYRKELDKIDVIISGTEEALPTITTVTDVTTGSVNDLITPGGGLNGNGSRLKITGKDEAQIGFFFIAADGGAETKLPATSLLRNEPSSFTLIIPPLADGGYYLEVATQYGGNSKQLLKEVRRNRFPYLLYVGKKPDTDGNNDL